MVIRMRIVPDLGDSYCDIVGPKNYFRQFAIKISKNTSE